MLTVLLLDFSLMYRITHQVVDLRYSLSCSDCHRDARNAWRWTSTYADWCSLFLLLTSHILYSRFRCYCNIYNVENRYFARKSCFGFQPCYT